MDQETPSSHSPSDPWITLGYDAANEDMLIGNRSGLQLLRDAIDAAIEKNEFFLPGEVGISGVRMVSIKPKWLSSNSCRDKAFALGCTAIAVICAGIFLFGCAELIQKLF